MVWLLAVAVARPAPVAWSGIDYGWAQLVGPGDFPADTLPGYANRWNALFVAEQLEVLGSRLKRPTELSTDGLWAAHADVDPARQLASGDDVSAAIPLLSRADVVARVATYAPGEPGMALALIAEQLNKPDRAGCFWITFYDRAELVVHRTTRRCAAPGGFGLRNYWFGSVKRLVAELGPKDVPPADEVVTFSERQLATAGTLGAVLADQLAQRADEGEPGFIVDEDAAVWTWVALPADALPLLEEAGIPYRVAPPEP